ncbi:MAG: hypothetical protein ACRDT6_02645 [Micromonosporaceae bacterium]
MASLTKVKVESLVRMARTCNNTHDNLDPWVPQRHADFKADGRAYGGIGSTTGPHWDELSFRYSPMSRAEYQMATGLKLDPDHDTGGERSGWDDFAGDFSMTGGRSSYPEEQRERWDDFYAAGGERRGEGSCGYNTEYDNLGASGDSAPWAAPLKRAWDTAVNNRLAEVKVVRAELGYLMTKLIKAGDKYAYVDLENAIHIRDKYDSYADPTATYGRD